MNLDSDLFLPIALPVYTLSAAPLVLLSDSHARLPRALAAKGWVLVPLTSRTGGGRRPHERGERACAPRRTVTDSSAGAVGPSGPV